MAKIRRDDDGRSVNIIYREDAPPFANEPYLPFLFGKDAVGRVFLIAKSFTLSYLKRLAKVN